MLTAERRRVGRVRGRGQRSEWVRLHVRRSARHAAAAAIRRETKARREPRVRAKSARAGSGAAGQSRAAGRGAAARLTPRFQPGTRGRSLSPPSFPRRSPLRSTGSVGQLIRSLPVAAREGFSRTADHHGLVVLLREHLLVRGARHLVRVRRQGPRVVALRPTATSSGLGARSAERAGGSGAPCRNRA